MKKALVRQHELYTSKISYLESKERKEEIDAEVNSYKESLIEADKQDIERYTGYINALNDMIENEELDEEDVFDVIEKEPEPLAIEKEPEVLEIEKDDNVEVVEEIQPEQSYEDDIQEIVKDEFEKIEISEEVEEISEDITDNQTECQVLCEQGVEDETQEVIEEETVPEIVEEIVPEIMEETIPEIMEETVSEEVTEVTEVTPTEEVKEVKDTSNLPLNEAMKVVESNLVYANRFRPGMKSLDFVSRS